MLEVQNGYKELRTQAIQALDNWILTINTLSGLFAHDKFYRFARGPRRDAFQWDLSKLGKNSAFLMPTQIMVKLFDNCSFEVHVFEERLDHANIDVKFPKLKKFNFNKYGDTVGKKIVVFEKLSLHDVIDVLQIIYDVEV